MTTLKSAASSALFSRQRLLRFASARSRRAYRTAFLLLTICVALTSILLVKVGSVHHNGFGHDTPVLLDGGWRILQGQRPHVDFYTPLGTFMFLVMAFGMSVAEPSANAVAYGTAAFFVMMTLLAWTVARGRMSATNAFLFSILVGFVIISPHPLGFAITNTSYAMIYNRYGFGILCVILAELFLPADDSADGRDARRDFLGGVSTGALIVVLFFLKYTYFAVALGAVSIKLLLSFAFNETRSGEAGGRESFARIFESLARNGRETRNWFYGVTVGALAVFVPMMFFLRFDFAALFGDALMVARTRGATLSGEKLWGVINLRDNIIAFALLVIFWLLVRVSLRRLINNRRLTIKIAIILLSTIVFGLMLILTNFQWGGMPLFPAVALIVWESVSRSKMASREREQDDGALLDSRAILYSWIIAFALFGQIFFADAASVGYAAWWHFSKADGVSASQRFESKQLYDLIVRPESNTESCNRAPYPEKINEAMSLVRARLKNDSRVLVLDFNNPISFGIGLPSPRGDALYWHYGTHFNSRNGVNFTEQIHPMPERVFADVTLVLVPKCPEEWETVELMLKIYREYVLEHFYMEAESRYWVVMVKRQ